LIQYDYGDLYRRWLISWVEDEINVGGEAGMISRPGNLALEFSSALSAE